MEGGGGWGLCLGLGWWSFGVGKFPGYEHVLVHD